MNDKADTYYQIMVDYLGKEKLLDELICALGDDETIEYLEFIARMHDIELR